MQRTPLASIYSVLGSIAFANNRISAVKRVRKQEPSQMQIAFMRARAKAL